MNAEWKDRQLYWACLHYARLWMLGDGILCKEIAANGLTDKIIREIAISYNVNRGLNAATRISMNPSGHKVDQAAIDLCEVLISASKTWPNTMFDRAKACEDIVTRAIEKNCFSKFQGSAVTKFMWFLKPDGWTMFDRFAAKGLGVNSIGGQGKSMLNFYKELEERKFEALSEKMQSVIDGSPTKGLPATRILDTLLMARGQRGDIARSIRASEFYLALLPVTAAKELQDIAEKLQSEFGNNVLTKP